jgi:hypothetical protein
VEPDEAALKCFFWLQRSSYVDKSHEKAKRWVGEVSHVEIHEEIVEAWWWWTCNWMMVSPAVQSFSSNFLSNLLAWKETTNRLDGMKIQEISVFKWSLITHNLGWDAIFRGFSTSFASALGPFMGHEEG